MIQYFVTYHFSSSAQTGDGCVNITMHKPIKSYADVMIMKDWLIANIKDEYGNPFKNVVILNWKRYEESTPVLRGDQAQRLLEAVRKWKKQYQPSCAESIYQVDSVNEACPELVEKLMDIIGWEEK